MEALQLRILRSIQNQLIKLEADDSSDARISEELVGHVAKEKEEVGDIDDFGSHTFAEEIVPLQ